MFGPAVIQKTVNQAVNGYIFLNQGRIRQQKERGWACLSYGLLKKQWAYNSHCPYSHWAMGNLYFFLFKIKGALRIIQK